MFGGYFLLPSSYSTAPTLGYRGRWRGHFCKGVMRQFSLLAFPPDLRGKNLWGRERKFSPDFSPLLFSFYSQIEKNSFFYPIFLLIFFILPKFHPTKHSVLPQFHPTKHNARDVFFSNIIIH